MQSKTHWTALLLLAFVACAVHGQDATTPADQALIDRIAKEYQTDRVLSADGNLNFNLLKLAKTLETNQQKLLGQNLTGGAYWDEVDNAGTAAIDAFNSAPQVIDRMKKLFQRDIGFFKARGQATKNDNDALVLFFAAIHKANDLDIDWQNKMRKAPRVGAATTGSAAAQAVPNWYKAMTEHKGRHWEHRAKVRAWRRAVHHGF